jgi:hypothetical protein
MKIILASSLALLASLSFITFSSSASTKLPIPLKQECKVYDILKGQLILTRSDGKNVSEIITISGNVTDGHHLYDQNGMIPLKQDDYFLEQIRRTKTKFAPMAILFQPSGEELQVISVRKLKPAQSYILFPNINHGLLADTRNGNYKRLGSLAPNSQKEFFYYPLFQSVGFQDSLLIHLQKGTDLTICFR